MKKNPVHKPDLHGNQLQMKPKALLTLFTATLLLPFHLLTATKYSHLQRHIFSNLKRVSATGMDLSDPNIVTELNFTRANQPVSDILHEDPKEPTVIEISEDEYNNDDIRPETTTEDDRSGDWEREIDYDDPAQNPLHEDNLDEEQSNEMAEIHRRNKVAYRKFENPTLSKQLDRQEFLWMFEGEGQEGGMLAGRSFERLMGDLMSDLVVSVPRPKEKNGNSIPNLNTSYRFTKAHNGMFSLNLPLFLSRTANNVDTYNTTLNNSDTEISITVEDWDIVVVKNFVDSRVNSSTMHLQNLFNLPNRPGMYRRQEKVRSFRRSVTVTFQLENAVVINDFVNNPETGDPDTTESLLVDDDDFRARKLVLRDWKKNLVSKIENEFEEFAVKNRDRGFFNLGGQESAAKRMVV